MHSERDWIRLICENPTDTNLRLVYADWLDEHELHPLQAQHIRADLWYDVSHLPENSVYRLLGGFNPKQYGVLDCEVRRGFLKSVVMDRNSFYEFGDRLFSIQPVEQVVLKEVDSTYTLGGGICCNGIPDTDLIGIQTTHYRDTL